MTLYWSVDRKSESITFAVQAKTTGWIGLGFSPGNGRMAGADIVIGWVQGGQAKLTNRHGEGHFLPALDDDQSTYRLLSGSEANGTTVLTFRRKIDTCSKQDIVLEAGTTKLIFAYNDEDPSSDSDIPKHSFRGSRSLLLLNYGRKDKPDPTWNKLEFLMKNHSIPSKQTSYACRTFEMPKLPGKRHIVRFEPALVPGNEGFVHHFVVFECHPRFNVSHLNYTMDCLDFLKMPQEIQTCKALGEITAAWGVGGGAFVYPDHVGYPIGMQDSGSILVMEVHYDNPEKLTGRFDSSGVRFYYTDKLRLYDSGTWSVGDSVNTWMMVPPKQEEWISEGHCPHQCTKQLLENTTLPEKGINVFASFLHTHLAGRGTWTKHFRDGVELPEIARDNYYDFNFQEIQALPLERHIRPGDDVIHYCKYNTMDRQKTVFGGFGTKDEMCINFMLYYPRLYKPFACQSNQVVTSYNFLSKHMPSLKPAATNRHMNPMSFVNVSWTKEMAEDLREIQKSAKTVFIEGCQTIPWTYPITSLAEGNYMEPKVRVSKPLNPPVSDCSNPAQSTAASLGLLLFACLFVNAFEV